MSHTNNNIAFQLPIWYFNVTLQEEGETKLHTDILTFMTVLQTQFCNTKAAEIERNKTQFQRFLLDFLKRKQLASQDQIYLDSCDTVSKI